MITCSIKPFSVKRYCNFFTKNVLKHPSKKSSLKSMNKHLFQTRFTVIFFFCNLFSEKKQHFCITALMHATSQKLVCCETNQAHGSKHEQWAFYTFAWRLRDLPFRNIFPLSQCESTFAQKVSRWTIYLQSFVVVESAGNLSIFRSSGQQKFDVRPFPHQQQARCQSFETWLLCRICVVLSLVPFQESHSMINHRCET